MLKKEALKIVGGLSKPSKMPCMSIGLPAKECVTGSKLRGKENSVCSDCYAMKGCYQWDVVQKAQYKRLESIKNNEWVPAMTKLLSNQSFFRWHDSGDIQDIEHLENIMEVVKNTPNCKHWIPTKEIKLIKEYLSKNDDSIPNNLCLRVSMPNIDQKAKNSLKGINTSTVHANMLVSKKEECKAIYQNGECRDCRKCWDKTVENVSYFKH